MTIEYWYTVGTSPHLYSMTVFGVMVTISSYRG